MQNVTRREQYEFVFVLTICICGYIVWTIYIRVFSACVFQFDCKTRNDIFDKIQVYIFVYMSIRHICNSRGQ